MAKSEIRNEYLAADVRGMSLEIGYAELTILEEATDMITVTNLRDDEKTSEYRCELKNGILEMTAGNAEIRISLFGSDRGIKTKEAEKDIITVIVPCGMKLEMMELSIGAGEAKLKNNSTVYDRVELEVGAGSMSVEALQVENHADVQVGAGNVVVDHLRARTADVECGVGKMSVKGAVDGDINIECGVGSIEMYLDADEQDYSYSIDCAIGTVIINGSKRSGFFASRSGVTHPNAKGMINLECGVGRVELSTQKRIG